MAGLTGQTVATTYHSLLKVSTSANQNLTTSLNNIVDGEDTPSCLSLTKNTGALAILSVDGDHAGGTQIQIDNSATDGDVSLAFQLSSTTTWLMGIEDGDSDSLKICHDTTLGTDERLSFLTASTVFNEDSGDIDFRVEGNGDANLLFCDAGNDRVGIGTASPAVLLDVRNTIDSAYDVSSSTTQTILGIRNPSSTSNCAAGIQFYAGNTNTGQAGIGVTKSAASKGEMYFMVRDGTNRIEAMRIDGAGRVGIGTTSPAYTLELEGDNTTALSLMNQSDTAIDDGDTLGTIYFGGRDEESSGTNVLGAKIVAEASGLWGTGADDDDAPTELQFFTQSDGGVASLANPRMVINDTGNVGIGIAAPGYPLHIYSDAAISSVTAKIEHNGANSAVAAQFSASCQKDGTSENRSGAIGSIYYDQSGASGTDAAIGFLYAAQGDGGATYMWPDNSGIWRTSTTGGDRGNGTGTIVGAQSSDERMKNISSDAFPYGLNEVNQLTPIKYAYKKSSSINHLGFGAQTTQNILPEVVTNTGECVEGYVGSMDEDGNITDTARSDDRSKLTMAYVEIVPVLVKAVQELSAKVTALENA
jgi:hypothetical protein